MRTGREIGPAKRTTRVGCEKDEPVHARSVGPSPLDLGPLPVDEEGEEQDESRENEGERSEGPNPLDAGGKRGRRDEGKGPSPEDE